MRGECKDIFVESDMSRPLVGVDYDISDVMLQLQKKGSSADLIVEKLERITDSRR